MVTDDGRRRASRAVWVLGALIMLAAAGLLIWSVVVPSYRPGLQAGEVYGIAVSHHQGDIDWEAVAADDIDFVFLKSTEGGDFVDRRFVENLAGANAAGLEVGAYHYFTLCTDGELQAANFLDTVPMDEVSLPPVLDLELGTQCTNPPPDDEVRQNIREFVETVEATTGTTVVLYLIDDFDERFEVSALIDRPLWHRSIMRRPTDKDWAFWQVTMFASVDGIEGGVDLNVGAGD